jgi:hypothetical protein
MTKKRHTAIVREMNWPTTVKNASFHTKNSSSHFTLIDARDLFCSYKTGDKDGGNMILKIIYLNKNSKSNN